MNKPLYTTAEWTPELVQETWEVIDKIAKETFDLDYYEPQIELITAEQMLDCYSSHAMPLMYDHWSFGKSFLRNERSYKKGQTGLAYEVVINTDPCIAYLVENNTMTLQALVLAHALAGHGSFFKHNYLFKEWTDASSIVDYLKYAKNYIKGCEEKHGQDAVESFLDSCHSLQYNSVDKYKKPPKLKAELAQKRAQEREEYIEKTFNDVWRTVIPKKKKAAPVSMDPKLPEENLLYFLEKNSPSLDTWQRELCRIVRKLSQYFYPQMQSSLMNEGWACFIHHHIMTEMHDQGHITDGSYVEFLHHHTNVVAQPSWTNKRYSGINIYALGYAMMMDIKRICVEPTEEDRKWFPDIVDTDWKKTTKDVMMNYRDESFVLQFLSPKIIRDFELFIFGQDEDNDYLSVDAVHDDDDIIKIRRALADSYDVNKRIPKIEVAEVAWDSDRWLYLDYTSEDGKVLEYDNMKSTVEHIQKLWGFSVKMTYRDTDGNEIDDI